MGLTTLEKIQETCRMLRETLHGFGLVRFQEAALFCALEFETPLEAQAILDDESTTEEEKRKQVMYRGNPDKWTTLMSAIEYKAPVGLNQQLIDYGGKELVMGRDGFAGRTALHCASKRDPPDVETLELLLKEGGKDLVHMQSRNRGTTALHDACGRSASPEVLQLLLSVGGTQLSTMKTHSGETAMDFLHNKHYHKTPPTEAIKLLQKAMLGETIYSSLNPEPNRGYQK